MCLELLNNDNYPVNFLIFKYYLIDYHYSGHSGGENCIKILWLLVGKNLLFLNAFKNGLFDYYVDFRIGYRKILECFSYNIINVAYFLNKAFICICIYNWGKYNEN